MSIETLVPEAEPVISTTAPTPRRVPNVSIETRLRFAEMLDQQFGIVDDPTVPTAELLRRVREATQPLADANPHWASRDLVAERDR